MKRVVVTGANKGIGLAIVKKILEEDAEAFVFLGARDATRGREAREGLVDANAAWAEHVEVLPLDVADEASVASAAASVASRLGAARLHGIVNNAGVGLGSSERRTVLDINTNGVRRVCRAFLPLLRQDGGRIVNVTSASGPMYVASCSAERQKFFLDASVTEVELAAFVDECMTGDDGDAYGLSKACANLYTLILARAHPNLRVNACTPGYIATDMTLAHAGGRDPRDLGMKTPAEGARAPIFLLLGEPEGTGHYYGSDALRSPLDRYRSPGSPAYRG